MDSLPKEEADEARETRSRGCIPRWRKCGIANRGLIPGLVDEYSLIRRVLRGEYLRANRIVVSACMLSKDAEARRSHATVATRRSPKVGEHVLSGASELELIRQGKS